MTHRTLVACLSIAALAGCSAGDTARSSSAPSLKISDGAHRQSFNDPNGNPDFFFLPTMVPNPVTNPNFDPDDFNPRLLPTVEVCVLDLLPTASESDVQLTTPCRPGGYFTSFGAPVNGGLQKYQGSWTVVVSDDVFYRIRVKVGDVSLGFADVHTVANPSLLHTVNQDQFVGQQDGSNLPIPFRIEIGALCTPAGLRPCDSATLGLETGGTVNISTDGGTTLSGVTLPPQSQAGNHTLTLQTCEEGDLNPRAVDLPTFGSCVTVSATPALTAALGNPAIVEVCDVAGDIISSGLTDAQEHRVTLHRLDGSVVRALPHVDGCAIVTGSTTPTFRSVLKEFARGNLGAAVGKLAAIVGPSPLNARRRRLDVGGGGATSEFSDFQFALPCKMAPHVGTGQTAGIITTLPVDPAFIVTDLAGTGCANATVHFATADGSVAPASATTAADGIARTDSWLLGPNVGAQVMTASGRGIAVVGNDGPRSIFDPFMAIQPAFNPASDPVPNPLQAVQLQTGTQTFGATGIIPFGSGGYSYKVVASNSTSPTGWQTPGFNEGTNGFTAGGTAPFASTGSPCSYTPATAWAKKTDILVRKTFTLPPGPAQTVEVRVAVDRYVIQAYLNGVLLNASSLSWNACAFPGAASNFILTGQGNAGANLLTIRASARSTSAFLDMRVAVQ